MTVVNMMNRHPVVPSGLLLVTIRLVTTLGTAMTLYDVREVAAGSNFSCTDEMTEGWVVLYGAVFKVSSALILLWCLPTSLQNWSRLMVSVDMAPFSSTLASGIISRGVH